MSFVLFSYCFHCEFFLLRNNLHFYICLFFFLSLPLHPLKHLRHLTFLLKQQLSLLLVQFFHYNVRGQIHLHSKFRSISMCFCMILRIPSLRSISDSYLNSLISHWRSLACSALIIIYLFAVVLSWDLNSDFLCILCINCDSFSRIYFFSFKRISLICSFLSASLSFRS